MKLTQALKTRRLYFDGGTGSVLQTMGLKPGERPEEWNLRHPDRIVALHRAYLEAGCNLLKTNTFGANRLRLGDDTCKTVQAGVLLAQRALEQISAPEPHYIALDVGPCGKLLRPLGDLDFEDAVALFAQVIRAGAEAGADLVLIETMNDAYETKAAVLAAKETCRLPVFVTNVYDESRKLMTGADPAAMVALLEGLGVDALGLNCSLGPAQMLQVLPELVNYASVPIIMNPNAGLPRSVDGKTVYDVTPQAFAADMRRAAQMGASVLGGCCGTTPEYIRAMRQATEDVPLKPTEKRGRTLVSSYTHAVQIGGEPVLIGERINPTGKERLKQALRAGDMDYLAAQATAQQEQGVPLLDVNVGLPGTDETALLPLAVEKIQAVCDLPLQLDSSNPAALEAAMRRYNGKPLVNSVSGKAQSLGTVLPLIKRYGGVVVALTLDENGIPSTVEGRLAVAEKILSAAQKYGIDPRDILFDPLALAASAEPGAAAVTLETVRCLHTRMHAKTVLGVSNCSFGLPRRQTVTAAFLSMALQAGLSAAIVDPMSRPVMDAYAAWRVLSGTDTGCRDYLRRYQSGAETPAEAHPQMTLFHAVEKGLAAAAAEAAAAVLKTHKPMEIINGQIVPALDAVGSAFEDGSVFLPQLLMSAEAASAAFSVLRKEMTAAGAAQDKGTILLATVQGDIHDIGKNIVRVLLENYGYTVVDLGRDVPPERILEQAKSRHIRLVGLSALMTTTVPAMERTIRLLHGELADCKVMVGGAVLTAEYAAGIGADAYAGDAMAAVRIAEDLFLNKETAKDEQ